MNITKSRFTDKEKKLVVTRRGEGQYKDGGMEDTNYCVQEKLIVHSEESRQYFLMAENGK